MLSSSVTASGNDYINVLRELLENSLMGLFYVMTPHDTPETVQQFLNDSGISSLERPGTPPHLNAWNVIKNEAQEATPSRRH